MPHSAYYQEYLLKHREKQNKGAYGRESEQSKTYEAEFAFQKKYGKIKNFKTVEEAQKRAKQIYASKKWQRVWKLEGRKTPTIKKPTVVLKERNTGRGFAGWTDGWGIILDSKVGLDEYVLLHELAHCLGHLHHGRSFRRALLELVGAFIGVDAKKMLKKEFTERKLKCGAESKPLSYEKWLESKQRMERIRGRKK